MTLEDELDEAILDLALAADRHCLPADVARHVERLRDLRQRIVAGELQFDGEYEPDAAEAEAAGGGDDE